MPDWLTHIVVGILLAEICGVRKKSLVALGAILPDVLPKLFLLGLFIPLGNINLTFLKAFHIPFIFFLFTILIAPLFKYQFRKIVLLLNLGGISHFLMDFLLRSFSDGQKILFPFSSEGYTANLVWPEQSFIILIPALILYLSIILFKKHRHRTDSYNYHKSSTKSFTGDKPVSDP